MCETRHQFKKTHEIFWQAVSGNRHFRPNRVSKSQTNTFSTIRKFARIPLAGWQGIIAKPAHNYDKAHDCDRAAQSVDRAGCRTTYWTGMGTWLVAQGDCGNWRGVGDGAVG